jgi:hypothetical protein
MKGVKQMKKVILAIALVLFATGAALAADVPDQTWQNLQTSLEQAGIDLDRRHSGNMDRLEGDTEQQVKLWQYWGGNDLDNFQEATTRLIELFEDICNPGAIESTKQQITYLESLLHMGRPEYRYFMLGLERIIISIRIALPDPGDLTPITPVVPIDPLYLERLAKWEAELLFHRGTPTPEANHEIPLNILYYESLYCLLNRVLNIDAEVYDHIIFDTATPIDYEEMQELFPLESEMYFTNLWLEGFLTAEMRDWALSKIPVPEESDPTEPPTEKPQPSDPTVPVNPPTYIPVPVPYPVYVPCPTCHEDKGNGHKPDCRDRHKPRPQRPNSDDVTPTPPSGVISGDIDFDLNGSGGGCDTGLGVMALAALALVWKRKK